MPVDIVKTDAVCVTVKYIPLAMTPIPLPPHPGPLPPAGKSCHSATAQMPNMSSSCCTQDSPRHPHSPLALTRLITTWQATAWNMKSKSGETTLVKKTWEIKTPLLSEHISLHMEHWTIGFECQELGKHGCSKLSINVLVATVTHNTHVYMHISM